MVNRMESRGNRRQRPISRDGDDDDITCRCINGFLPITAKARPNELRACHDPIIRAAVVGARYIYSYKSTC